MTSVHQIIDIRRGTITDANRVLAVVFSPPGTVWLERVPNGRLYLCTEPGSLGKQVRKGAVLNNAGDALGCRYGDIGFGATQARAVGQIVRWVRGLTRLPLKAWRHWTSERVALCSPDIVTLLDQLGYEHPDACCCVLCNLHPDKMCGLDWWSLNGVVGPCCSFGRCWETRHSSPNAPVKELQ